jgi:hypothetical protein
MARLLLSPKWSKTFLEVNMTKLIGMIIIAGTIASLSACGDKKDSTEAAKDAQKIIQEGMQKEKSMVEGMVKAGENLDKKMPEQKEETKK